MRREAPVWMIFGCSSGYGRELACEVLARGVETYVFGLFEATEAVLPGMRAQRSGLIVDNSSIGGLTAFAATGYSHAMHATHATKFAISDRSE